MKKIELLKQEIKNDVKDFIKYWEDDSFKKCHSNIFVVFLDTIRGSKQKHRWISKNLRTTYNQEEFLNILKEFVA